MSQSTATKYSREKGTKTCRKLTHRNEPQSF
uniref:Uncharacterized protein n=1 Tax=Tetraselmis sp. GSL018 TaxID=582737 RepID=A0A061SGY4_9CHLO